MTFRYDDSGPLRTRKGLYQRFSTNSTPWDLWLRERILVNAPRVILDIGGGYGGIWRHGFDAASQIILTDRSFGIVKEAKPTLGQRLFPAVMNAECLAVKADSVDLVTALHVMYHVRNRPAALDEVVRVMRSSGVFAASTIGRDHLAELRQIVGRFAPMQSDGFLPSEFSLEQAAEELQRYFERVSLEVYPDSLMVTDAKALMDYIQTTPMGESLDTAQAEPIAAELEATIRSYGAFRITSRTGVLVCARPAKN